MLGNGAICKLYATQPLASLFSLTLFLWNHNLTPGLPEVIERF